MEMTDWEKNRPYHQLAFVEGGSFLMGGDDEAALDREKPVHQVRVDSFYLGKYPVTQDLWQDIMGNNPARFNGGNRPVESISWHETQDFLKKLNRKTGKTYRLPTEAEWEYAARGGSRSEGYIYSGSDRLEQVGWYGNSSGGQTNPVGKKLANELGLYDMSGNVWEWVEDTYHDSYTGATKDGSAWRHRGFNAPRVRRGGCWNSYAQSCRVSCRSLNGPESRYFNLGFRLAVSFQSGD